jgi:hypothetical protein
MPSSQFAIAVAVVAVTVCSSESGNTYEFIFDKQDVKNIVNHVHIDHM